MFAIKAVFVALAVSANAVTDRETEGPEATREMLDYGLWWTSDYRETDEVELPVQGKVPDWLDGTLYRNGPGRFEVGDRRVTHQFDALAKLYKFRFSKGQVHYATKFLKSAQYNTSIEKNDVIKGMDMYAPVPPRSYQERMKLLTSKNDNALINVWKTGDFLFVTQDGALTSMIDPVTLDYLGYGPPIKEYDYLKHLNTMQPAHPVRRVGTEATINMLIDTVVKPTGFAQKGVIYEDSPDMTRRIIGRFELPYMTICHSFPVTENYVIFIGMPLEIHPQDFMDGKVDSAVGMMHWHGEKPTTLYVFDIRKTEASPVGIFETEALFYNHQVNGFETQGANGTVLNLDLIGYDDSEFLTRRETFGSVDLMRDTHRVLEYLKHDAPHPNLRRVSIDLGEKRASIQKRLLKDPSGDEVTCEMPRINDAFFGKDYCFIYAGCVGLKQQQRGQFLQPTKLNACTGEATYLSSEPAMYADEAIFIPNGETAEDAGLLAVPRLDATKGKTAIVLYDAQTLKEVARALAPFHHPSGVHGRFFNSPTSKAILV
jgi:carotenoid cleavage dioxygenase-like enzyme